MNINARSLIAITGPYLRIKPYKEWDKQQIEIVRDKIRNEANGILSFVVDELDKFSRGEVSRLLTLAQSIRREVKEYQQGRSELTFNDE